MIRYDTAGPATIRVMLCCDSCEAVTEKEISRDTLLPFAARDLEQDAIANGWRRNVPVPISRPGVTGYDKDGKPVAIEPVEGTTPGDLCPDCASKHSGEPAA